MREADNSFDTVVIGSGFGGSVTTYRLAEAGQRVCLLERGKAYAPGSFERNPAGLARAVWDPSEGRHGLFDVWTFRGIDAVVASGLGGGSLIYANVLLRKPREWFVRELMADGFEDWPISYDELEPHYDRVEDMIGVNQYPAGHDGFDVVKAKAFQAAAGGAQYEWSPAPLGVAFAAPGEEPARGRPLPMPRYGNYHDRDDTNMVRLTCRLCGECDIGCNYGSKNSMDHTYLSRASSMSDIRTRCEVKEIEARDGGYVVRYVRHEEDEETGRPARARSLPVREVTAKRVVLAAGALGSTYLLMRSQRSGLLPGIVAAQPSGPLGTRFSGNGDFFAVALRARNGDGSPRTLGATQGSVITGVARVPRDADGAPGRRGFYVQDGGYPAFVDWLTEGLGPGLPWRLVEFGARRFAAWAAGDPNGRLGRDIARLIGPALLTSTSMPLLGMGRDVPDGRMSLRGRDGRYLGVKWNRRSSRAYVGELREAMKSISSELGATYRDSPLWRYIRRAITVHPLGGAPMGRDSSTGVVDRYGQAFGQDGLFVVDGAAMPGAIGPNPALTIAAYADWVSEAIIDGRTARR
jgi:cholesterol oxidase